MKDTNHLDLFQCYEHDQLPPAERTAFEQRLASDADFAGEWQFYQLANQATREVARAREDAATLRAQLEAEGFFEKTHAQIHTEMAAERAAAQTPPAPLRTSWLSPGLRQWAVAASLALVAIALWWLKEHREHREQAIAKAIEQQLHYNFEETPTQYGAAAQSDTLLLAEKLFNEGQFEQALTLLQTKAKPWDENVKYLLARIWFAKADYRQCISQLEEILRGRPFLETRWKAELLEAQAFLKMGDRDQAKALLDTYLQTDADNPNKQELLKIARQIRQNL